MDRLSHALNHCARKANQAVHKQLPGFIYLMKCHEFYKLGITTRVRFRLAAVQCGCPYPVELLATWESLTMPAHEYQLHQNWRHCHERGEWHRIPADYAEKLKSCRTIEEALAVKQVW